MVLPLADAITQVADNFTKRVDKLVQQIDEGIAKITCFPYTIGFDSREEVAVLTAVCTKYQTAGYNLKLVKHTVTENQKNAYIMYLTHSAPYADAGSHVLFKC